MIEYGRPEICGVYNGKKGYIYCPLTPPRDSSPNPDWRTYDPLRLHFRDHTTSKRWAERVARTGDETTTRRTGMTGRTIPWDLESIVFPWSYGLMRCTFFTRTSRLGCVTTGQYPLDTDDSDRTANAYLISQGVRRDIERDMERIVYPTAFGDKLRSLLPVRKAAEWKGHLACCPPGAFTRTLLLRVGQPGEGNRSGDRL